MPDKFNLVDSLIESGIYAIEPSERQFIYSIYEQDQDPLPNSRDYTLYSSEINSEMMHFKVSDYNFRLIHYKNKPL